MPVTISGDEAQARTVLTREARMARFAAGSRLVRLFAVGGLIAVGWLMGVILGLAGAAPAAADVHFPAGHLAPVKVVEAVTPPEEVVETVETRDVRRALSTTPHAALGPASAGGFPTMSDSPPADAGAMAGRTVDGLTSQSKPALPAPSSAEHSAGANGFVPRGSGSGPYGPGFGDVAGSVFDPRLAVMAAEPVGARLPVVRTTADDPSFSPD
ncbi:hypothetical protein [Sphaerisporangium sp. TRM90804]|uniref:hypothetical protein n=1 Tax=Sphaerisporangium sp. TRM90804 TaxID=3031113 RepID=UPI00244C27C6|nr:hypothetical protein [Sphaerisporangium sp. TRM90804]MDH2426480.1 hypothetical protein [Sphaerisporangium sp. TRM90804]